MYCLWTDWTVGFSLSTARVVQMWTAQENAAIKRQFSPHISATTILSTLEVHADQAEEPVLKQGL
jgi:hypothetical protein